MTLKVSMYMSTGIRTIGRTIPIETAWKRMTDLRVRHLPVLEGGKLVGIVSDRDLRNLVSFHSTPHTTPTQTGVMAPAVPHFAPRHKGAGGTAKLTAAQLTAAKLTAAKLTAAELTVEDVMVPDPYIVGPDTDLAEVAEEMGKHRLGSAIVQDKAGKLIGIFTFEDGMRALADVLRRSEGEKAA